MRQTIYMIRGTMCAGKTSLVMTLQGGQRHLVSSPTLAPLFDNEWAYLDVGPITDAFYAEEPILPLVREAFGDRPYMVAEPCYNPAAQFYAEVTPHYDLVHVYLFAPAWLVDARRKLRFVSVGAATAQTVADYPGYTLWNTPEFLPGAAEVQSALDKFPTAPPVWLDTRDLPMREVNLAAVDAMVRGQQREPQWGIVEGQYQQCLHVGDTWYGSTLPERRAFEQARLDAVLPADLTGQTVLDIGASDGGFCYEALNRGALYCMAVEVRPDRVALMREVRDACQLPLGVADLDVNCHEVPYLHSAGSCRPYRLGLLLNVLHHTPEPQAVLERVLEACETVVVEGPALGDGDKPHQPGLPPYPHYTHLPEGWVRKVAAQNGFEMTEIAPSPYQGDFRKVCKLRRLPGG